jgi:hypothetical protein
MIDPDFWHIPLLSLWWDDLGISNTRRIGFPAVGEAAREKNLDLTDGPRFTNIIKKKKGGGMKILLGGIVALIIGFVGLAFWWFEFLRVLKGVVPIIFVLGGALAVYLGIEDIKTTTASPPSEEKKE